MPRLDLHTFNENSSLAPGPTSARACNVGDLGELAQNAVFIWTPSCPGDQQENKNMLWTIFVILLVLWLLGLVTSYTFGGFVHILLVLALVVLVINVIQGRRVV